MFREALYAGSVGDYNLLYQYVMLMIAKCRLRGLYLIKILPR